MQQLIEAHCKGTLRSYKTFHASGEVKLHTIHDFVEWDFDDNHIVTITTYSNHRRTVQAQTDQWTIEFQNRRHYIQITQPAIRYEILSLNHTGMVLADNDRLEKLFFAYLSVWERLISNRLPVL